jgi:phosphoenolpyruvate phosphomutase
MKAESILEGRILLCYGDILFDRSLLDMLMARDEDIVLVVDPTFQRSKQRNKKLDLVKTKFKPSVSRRSLAREANPVLGVALDDAESGMDYEFTGMMLFSPAGTRAFRREYHEAKEAYAGKPFQQAATFERASLTDMLNHMIERGHRMVALEVTSGWTEVHTFEDYRLACRRAP